MGKTQVNEAKKKGAQHSSSYAAKRSSHILNDVAEAMLPMQGGGSVAATLKKAEDEQKAAFYQGVFEEVHPLVSLTLAQELGEIEKLLAELTETQEHHERAAVLRQRKQALLTARSTMERHLEQVNPDFAERDEQARRLNNLMEARKRFLGGVAIPAWAPGSPELARLDELIARIENAKARAFNKVDELVAEVSAEMSEGGYDAHLAEQDSLWKAFHESRK